MMGIGLMLNPYAVGDSTPGGADDVLLIEDSFALLLEDGDNLILE